MVLDPHSPFPPFEQVRFQMAAAIQTGTLQPAVRLPTVRKLAADLGLAVNTVARAYRELELAGFIETRGRRGTFVAGAAAGTRREAALIVRDFVSRMGELDIGPAETLALVRREIERHMTSEELGLESVP